MTERVAILGAGQIGESLLAGLLSAGRRDIVVTARREERVRELADRHGVEATLANAEAAGGAAIVVLAVKPQDIEVLLAEIRDAVGPGQTVVSVAAAVTTARIERGLADGTPVVRAMPNAPATVHEGIAGICAGTHADAGHLARASTAGGTVRRSALAVVRLMKSSKLVGCITGRSAGFSPLRMRPVYTPTRCRARAS